MNQLPIERKSSYNKKDITYTEIFKLLVYLIPTNYIVEIGILDGFSLQILVDNCPKETKIEAYDIFDEFNGNCANQTYLSNKFSKYSNLSINKGNYYDLINKFKDESIDILHVDIANNGEVYTYAIQNYLKKIKKGGIIILEGGTSQRDQVDWMSLYNKKLICPILNNIKRSYQVLGEFPGICVIKKEKK